jgi:hypothetical protein
MLRRLLIGVGVFGVLASSGCESTEGGPGPLGVGVCCPRAPEPDCHCPAVGGWALSLDECNNYGVCDENDWRDSVDDFGCPIWEEGNEGDCQAYDEGEGEGEGEGDGEGDAGPEDAGPQDAGPLDAGALDAGDSGQ